MPWSSFRAVRGRSSLTTSRRRSSAVRGGTPVCIRSSWPCAATSAWNRSPARHATRNRKESSRAGVRYVKAQCPGGPQRGAGRPGRTTGVWPRDGATRWPTSGCTRPPSNAPSTAFSKNAPGCVPCRPFPSTPTRSSPSSSRPMPACVMTATATPCRRRWSASRSRCGPTPARCGSSIRARRWRGTRAATSGAS